MDRDIDVLERLFKLREQGALTEDEFVARKAKLFDAGENGPRRNLPVAILAVAVVLLAVTAVTAILLRWGQSQGASPPTAAASSTSAPRVTQPIKTQPPISSNLDDVLVFTKPSDCRMSDQLHDLFWRMVRIDKKTSVSSAGEPIKIAGYDQPIVPEFDRNHEVKDGTDIADVIAKLPLQGRLWHGLHVKRLFLYYNEASSLVHYQFDFQESPVFAKRSLDAVGFKLKAIGDTKVILPKAWGGDIDLGMYVAKAAEGGSSLVCSTEINYGG